VTEVSLGKAGIVLGLEVSRLARKSTDWRRLLEICALTDTLILDEDGVYDPSHFNDRLLLGLKGTMSEAELHVLRVRLQGGILNKARCGELHVLYRLASLQRQQRACTRSRPADPGKHSILFRDASAYRIGLRGRQSLPREKASVSAAVEEGTEQRRSGVV
jgi:DNA invertase Pin-like site-specific DNA recombinase